MMPRQHRLSEPGSISALEGDGSSGRSTAVESASLAGLLHEVVGDLFAAGLQTHLALDAIDGDAEPARRMQDVIARLDRAITVLRLASRADSDADPRRVERVEPLPALTDWHDIVHAAGILAERRHVSIADAVALLAAHARRHDRRLAHVARAVVEGTVDPSHRPD